MKEHKTTQPKKSKRSDKALDNLHAFFCFEFNLEIDKEGKFAWILRCLQIYYTIMRNGALTKF